MKFCVLQLPSEAKCNGISTRCDQIVRAPEQRGVGLKLKLEAQKGFLFPIQFGNRLTIETRAQEEQP